VALEAQDVRDQDPDTHGEAQEPTRGVDDVRQVEHVTDEQGQHADPEDSVVEAPGTILGQGVR
jgi:hypothetical protein